MREFSKHFLKIFPNYFLTFFSKISNNFLAIFLTFFLLNNYNISYTFSYKFLAKLVHIFLQKFIQKIYVHICTLLHRKVHLIKKVEFWFLLLHLFYLWKFMKKLLSSLYKLKIYLKSKCFKYKFKKIGSFPDSIKL